MVKTMVSAKVSLFFGAEGLLNSARYIAYLLTACRRIVNASEGGHTNTCSKRMLYSLCWV